MFLYSMMLIIAIVLIAIDLDAHKVGKATAEWVSFSATTTVTNLLPYQYYCCIHTYSYLKD